jgi:cell division protein ftsQ
MQNKQLRKYQRPNLVKVLLRNLLLLLMLGGAISFIYWFYYDSNYFAIKKFNILSATGPLYHISSRDISQVLAPYQQAKPTLLRINISQLKNDFEQQLWIEKAQISRIWPDSLEIVISERKPLARWATGEDILVDDHGRLFYAHTPTQLVVFKGPEGTEKIIFHLYKQIIFMLQGKGLKLTQLQYTNRSTWILFLDTGTRIFLGREQILPRLRRLLNVWNTLLTSDERVIEGIYLQYATGFAVKYGAEKRSSGKELTADKENRSVQAKNGQEHAKIAIGDQNKSILTVVNNKKASSVAQQTLSNRQSAKQTVLLASSTGHVQQSNKTSPFVHRNMQSKQGKKNKSEAKKTNSKEYFAEKSKRIVQAKSAHSLKDVIKADTLHHQAQKNHHLVNSEGKKNSQKGDIKSKLFEKINVNKKKNNFLKKEVHHELSKQTKKKGKNSKEENT